MNKTFCTQFYDDLNIGQWFSTRAIIMKYFKRDTVEYNSERIKNIYRQYVIVNEVL